MWTPVAAPRTLVLNMCYNPQREPMGKGKGKLVIFRHDNLGRGAIEAAYHWAMLVEPGEYAKPLRVISPLVPQG